MGLLSNFVSPTTWWAVPIVAVLAYFFLPLLVSKYPNAPGPFWARVTMLWQGYKYSEGNFHNHNIALHRRYGKIVRVGPKFYSFDDPEATKVIYGHGTQFTKAEFYDAFNVLQDPVVREANLFAQRDVKTHSNFRRRLANLYAMSSLVSYEPYVDKCIEILSDKLKTRAREGRTIDLTTWFQYYAFDVIGEITFSKRFGFMETGRDVDGLMAVIGGSLETFQITGLFRPLRIVVEFVSSLASLVSEPPFIKFAKAHVERVKNEQLHGSADAKERGAAPDFISKLIASTDGDEKEAGNTLMSSAAAGNIFAGSDTTSISLSALYFNILSRPDVLAKLRAEVDAACAQGEFSDPPTFAETHKLPYFQAVIKEALRFHPAVGLPLWRVVPAGGVTLSGTYFPAGTVVGVNAWVIHHNRQVFGADAPEFRPERWIDSPKDQLKAMNDMYMPFGLGSRTCIGKNISLLEISKLIPQLVRKFDMSLVGSGSKTAGLPVRAAWFVKQRDFIVNIKERIL